MRTRLTIWLNQYLIKIIATIIAISLILFTLTLGLIWNMYASFNELFNNQFRISQLSNQVVYLDEVLTMSAHMAVATVDSAATWEIRYKAFSPQLDNTLNELYTSSPESYHSSIKQIIAINNDLDKMELYAFDLLKQRQIDEAHNILYGQDYLKKKVCILMAFKMCVDYHSSMQRLPSNTINTAYSPLV